MPRAKRGFKARRRRNRILNHAEGLWGGRSRLFAVANEVVHKAWQYAYIGRKRRKRCKPGNHPARQRIKALRRSVAKPVDDPVRHAVTRARSGSPLRSR